MITNATSFDVMFTSPIVVFVASVLQSTILDTHLMVPLAFSTATNISQAGMTLSHCVITISLVFKNSLQLLT